MCSGIVTITRTDHPMATAPVCCLNNGGREHWAPPPPAKLYCFHTEISTLVWDFLRRAGLPLNHGSDLLPRSAIFPTSHTSCHRQCHRCAFIGVENCEVNNGQHSVKSMVSVVVSYFCHFARLNNAEVLMQQRQMEFSGQSAKIVISSGY